MDRWLSQMHADIINLAMWKMTAEEFRTTTAPIIPDPSQCMADRLRVSSLREFILVRKLYLVNWLTKNRLTKNYVVRST